MLVFELSHAEFSRTTSSRKLPCEGQPKTLLVKVREVFTTVNCGVSSERSDFHKNLLMWSERECLKQSSAK